MATIVWKDAEVLADGVALHGAMHELNVDYSAEMLDATVFGLETRTNRGGLFSASISGQGYFDTAVGIESLVFPRVGEDGTVLAVFPEGVTAGATASGSGFAMQGVWSEFNLGGAVGTLVNITFSAQTQGLAELST